MQGTIKLKERMMTKLFPRN